MDLYRALWRRRWLIVILTIATVVSAYVAVSRQTKMYKSTTLVRVEQQFKGLDPTQLGSAFGVAQHLAQTYQQIVTTHAMAVRISKVLHGRVPASDVSLSASEVGDLELLDIAAKSANPQEAADVANAAPVALRSFIAESRTAGTAKEFVVTVNPATASFSPVSPRVKLSLVIAFIAGLVFNGGLALVIEFLSDRLPEVDDIEAAFGKPVLATVPMLEFRSPDIERLKQQLVGDGREQSGGARLGRPEPRRTG